MEGTASISSKQLRNLLIGMAAVALLATACAGGSSATSADGFSASYAINVCGRGVEPFPEFDGAVHTHGDGVIHMHSAPSSEQEEDIRLVTFFENAGGALSERSLQLPGEAPWRTGNICPNGRPGRLTVIVNQDRLGPDVIDYVPRDGDRIVVAFVPAGSPPPSLPPPPASHDGLSALLPE